MLCRLDTSCWSTVAGAYPAFNFQQSLAYCEALAALRRATNEFVEIKEKGASLGVACVRVRSSRIPIAGLAFVSAGPLLKGDSDEGVALRNLTVCAGALAAEYVGRRGLTLRLAPSVSLVERHSQINAALESLGFQVSAVAPRYRTILVDLTRQPEVIRSSLAQKWRNQLNGAMRQAITVDISRTSDAFERFRPLFDEMQARKRFDTELGPDFYDRVQRTAGESERLVVATAQTDGEAVAGAVLDVGNEVATYILGATTGAGMKCKAAYALHWRLMMHAREAGCRWYDLGGIDPEGNPGVHHFKSGFGGVEVTAPGPYDLRPAGLHGWISVAFERLYRWGRGGSLSRAIARFGRDHAIRPRDVEAP
jgi:hypothetical protein